MLRRFRAHPIPPKIILLVLVLLIIGLAIGIYNNMKTEGEPNVQNFDACVAAGNPILHTRPEQCVHKGKSFFRPGEAPYNPKADLIQ